MAHPLVGSKVVELDLGKAGPSGPAFVVLRGVEMMRITSASSDDLVTIIEGPTGTPVQSVGVPHEISIAQLTSSTIAPLVAADPAVVSRLLATSERAAPILDPYTATATVTLSANGAASTIVGARRVPLTRLNASTYDTDNDPSFNHIGIPQGGFSVQAGDMAQGNLLTGGAAQAARWIGRHSLIYDGAKIGFFIRGTVAAGFHYRIWVNGQPLTTASVLSTALVSAGRYHLEVDFGSAAPRLIELDLDTGNPQFGGVFIEPTATVRRAPGRMRLAVLGDSITGGSGTGGLVVWPYHTASQFGCDPWRLSIGSTGYLAGAGTNSFIDRIPDVRAVDPDLLYVFGGYNDLGSSSADVGAAATALFAALKAAVPRAIIIVVGMWQPSEATSGVAITHDAAISAAAGAAGLPFISLIDPSGRLATAAPWAFSTSYLIGDVVSSANNVWVCTVAHTSASSGTISTTNFQPLSFITGTGRAGATTGRGNADLFINSDGVHLSALGQQVLGHHIAYHTQQILRRLPAIQ